MFFFLIQQKLTLDGQIGHPSAGMFVSGVHVHSGKRAVHRKRAELVPSVFDSSFWQGEGPCRCGRLRNSPLESSPHMYHAEVTRYGKNPDSDVFWHDEDPQLFRSWNSVNCRSCSVWGRGSIWLIRVTQGLGPERTTSWSIMICPGSSFTVSSLWSRRTRPITSSLVYLSFMRAAMLTVQ